tara:strand:+ start:127 stop:288 length:162 start_codon:yes stop_codon:yes gene_type:complete
MKRSNSARLELISNKKQKQDEPDFIRCHGLFYAIMIFIVFKLITIKYYYYYGE